VIVNGNSRCDTRLNSNLKTAELNGKRRPQLSGFSIKPQTKDYFQPTPPHRTKEYFQPTSLIKRRSTFNQPPPSNEGLLPTNLAKTRYSYPFGAMRFASHTNPDQRLTHPRPTVQPNLKSCLSPAQQRPLHAPDSIINLDTTSFEYPHCDNYPDS
jgi:hypothetical protein